VCSSGGSSFINVDEIRRQEWRVNVNSCLKTYLLKSVDITGHRNENNYLSLLNYRVLDRHTHNTFTGITILF
jgi:hypothetical protein